MKVMPLWELPPADLYLMLDHLVTLGEQPTDPHEALVYLEYLKHPPSEEGPSPVFHSLLEELRRLGRQAPVRHRGFASTLTTLSPGKSTLAIRAMREQAEMGDGDAALALVRAALETQDEPTWLGLLETLPATLPYFERVERLLELYHGARKNELLQLLAPPPLGPIELPVTSTDIRPAPRRSLSVTRLEGPGMLLVVSSTNHLETIKVARDLVEIRPYGYRHPSSPRQIARCRLSDDLHLLVLFYTDGTLELISRTSGKSLAHLPNREYQCFARTGNQILVGGRHGIYNVRAHKNISDEPVRAVGPGKLVCHLDGRVTLRGEERFHLDPAYRLRLGPDGRTLAVWDSHGEVEIFDLQGELVGRFYCAEDDPDLTYDLDSKSLVVLQNGVLKRWRLDGGQLPPIAPPAAKKSSRPAQQGPLDLNLLAQHDGFFDRLQR